MKSKSVVIFIANKDFDEQEFVIVKSYLIKNKFNVFICSDSTSICIGNNGLKVKNDILLNNLKASNFSGLILIGGKGISDYFNNNELMNKVASFYKNKKVIGAICAAPVILAKSDILQNTKSTCNINYKKDLERERALFVSEPVVTDHLIVTAQEPINSIDFILKFINLLK
ncbi:MAG TPA: DJ-1/PfpI family protein [Melioribacteraceae bacterium]|nr:DJ-1/PfpI family protein [Melioribacteraceae bacterium]